MYEMPMGKKIEAFETRGGRELNGPTGGGELSRFWWKNIHPCLTVIMK